MPSVYGGDPAGTTARPEGRRSGYASRYATSSIDGAPCTLLHARRADNVCQQRHGFVSVMGRAAARSPPSFSSGSSTVPDSSRRREPEGRVTMMAIARRPERQLCRGSARRGPQHDRPRPYPPARRVATIEESAGTSAEQQPSAPRPLPNERRPAPTGGQRKEGHVGHPCPHPTASRPAQRQHRLCRGARRAMRLHPPTHWRDLPTAAPAPRPVPGRSVEPTGANAADQMVQGYDLRTPAEPARPRTRPPVGTTGP